MLYKHPHQPPSPITTKFEAKNRQQYPAKLQPTDINIAITNHLKSITNTVVHHRPSIHPQCSPTAYLEVSTHIKNLGNYLTRFHQRASTANDREQHHTPHMAYPITRHDAQMREEKDKGRRVKQVSGSEHRVLRWAIREHCITI